MSKKETFAIKQEVIHSVVRINRNLYQSFVFANKKDQKTKSQWSNRSYKKKKYGERPSIWYDSDSHELIPGWLDRSRCTYSLMHVAKKRSQAQSSRVTLIDVAKLMDDRNKKVRLASWCLVPRPVAKTCCLSPPSSCILFLQRIIITNQRYTHSLWTFFFLSLLICLISRIVARKTAVPTNIWP